ncbi:MAG: hypothetical protein B7Z08_02720 [Sphingomonadales bacterium 32-68-7]|nr:MAG: hypothetical protein B7Z33_11055 [Sphingomonadales bacterium 12-68-11]OYX09963.1 MAG: hypothetical protein B7Z08_02720 [Sphingomonadales bacterium 32-68-7]
MKTITKALVGTVAAGAMAVGSMAPAHAQSRYDRDRGRDRGGIDAGDVIAGALIIGGIAAIASATSRNSRDRYDDRYENGWGRYGDPRQAIEQCVNTAERGARRFNADVTDIRSVDRRGDGYVVKGRIAVNQLGRNWRQGDNRYGRGWNNDYRGWNDRYRGYDAGNFTCRIERGRVTDLDYSGIRGL